MRYGDCRGREGKDKGLREGRRKRMGKTEERIENGEREKIEGWEGDCEGREREANGLSGREHERIGKKMTRREKNRKRRKRRRRG